MNSLPLDPNETPPCPACANRTSSSGLYLSQCASCAASLLLSAHPLKAQAAALLEATTRMPGSPGREAILAEVKRRLETRNERAV